MNNPIRVLQVIGIMNRGGAEAMIMNLYRSIDRSRVQFDFVENSFEPAAFDEEIGALGGKIYRCPHYCGTNHFAYKRWWVDFFKTHANEYSIVHGHLGSTAAIYLKLAKKYGLYTIAHSHNTWFSTNLKEWIYMAYAYPTRHIADHFFACSMAAGVSRYGKRIVNDVQRFTLINNAIDASKFVYHPQTRQRLRKAFGLQGKTVIGHIGRFNPQKNHPFLLDIFAEIHRMNASSVLMLVGDGDTRKEAQEKAKALHLSEAVIFMGVRSDIADLLQVMDVLVFPSLFEGLPVTVIEAQSSGLPCLLSDRITQECKLTPETCFFSLEASCAEWASKALKMAEKERKDTSQWIREAHYDIVENAQWLQQFYLHAVQEAKL